MIFLKASVQCFLIMPLQNSFHLEELNLLLMLTWPFSVFQELFTENYNLSDCFIILFGESLTLLHLLMKWILFITGNIIIGNIHIIHQIQNVRVCYLGWEFWGHTTNNDLLNKIEDGTSMLTMKNLKLILMDCPNVNWKLFECFISKRESKEHSGLISIGNCNLHVLNNVSKQEQIQLVRICIGWWILS